MAIYWGLGDDLCEFDLTLKDIASMLRLTNRAIDIYSKNFMRSKPTFLLGFALHTHVVVIQYRKLIQRRAAQR